jgi:hypothetical protein
VTTSISNWYVILLLGPNSLSCTKNLVTLSPFYTPFCIWYFFFTINIITTKGVHVPQVISLKFK